MLSTKQMQNTFTNSEYNNTVYRLSYALFCSLRSMYQVLFSNKRQQVKVITIEIFEASPRAEIDWLLPVSPYKKIQASRGL